MKKFLSLVILISIATISFTGCQWIQSTTDEKVEYISEEYGFSIVFPNSAKGYTTQIETDPIPPEALETIEFSVNNDYFLTVGIFAMDETEKTNEIGRSDRYIFTATAVTSGLADSFVLSDNQVSNIKNSFQVL